MKVGPPAARRPAIFLDRDGVVNEAVVLDGRALSPSSIGALVILPGVHHAIRRLRRAGFQVVVVTNQPDVARGTLDPIAVDTMHERLRTDLALDAVYVCTHDNADGCDCRKPQPGMLLRAAAEHGLDLASSWMVGDRWVDIAAGRAAGVRTVLVRRDYSWTATSSGAPTADLEADVEVADLPAATTVILGAAAQP